MALLNDNIVDLIEGIVDILRDEGTIITENYDANTGLLTLGVSSTFGLSVGQFIIINGENYKIDSFTDPVPATPEIVVVASGVTGGATFKVAHPYFFHGTYQMVETQIAAINDNQAKLPAVFMFYNIEERRVLDRLSAFSRIPKLQFAFLGESNIGFKSDDHQNVIDVQNELAEKFLVQLQANQFVGQMKEVQKTYMANFGVFIAQKGELKALLRIQSSGVLLSLDLPIYNHFDQCHIANFEFFKCAPGLIKDSAGNLIQTLGAGQVYVVAGGGGDVEIYDTDGNLLYTVTAPASQAIQNSNAQLNVNGGATFKNETLLAEETKVVELTVHNTLNDDVGTGIVFGGLIRIADSTVENSNASYSQNVAAEQTLVLPDIDFTDSDGTTTQIPSMEDVVCTPAVTPSGIAYQRPVPTGSITSYRTGDDAYFFNLGQRDFIEPPYPLSYALLDSFIDWYTLKNNNVFGNKNRFTNDLGGSVYNGSDGSTSFYMIDHLTGLAWDRQGKGSDTWNNHIDGGLAHSLGSYTTGWFLPNRAELLTVADQSRPSNKVFQWFSGSGTTNAYWTSSPVTGASMLAIDNDNAVVAPVGIGSIRPAFYCRIHFPSL